MNLEHPDMARLRVLAIAVATGRVGHAFFVGGRPQDWKMSKKAWRSIADAERYAQQLIAFHKPDVVVTEKIGRNSRKGEHAKRIIAALARVAERAILLDVVVPRIQHYQNKYAEARAFAERFPELAPRLPRVPRLWQSEPFATIYFEAVALAVEVIDRKPA